MEVILLSMILSRRSFPVCASETGELPIDQIVLNQFAVPVASVATNADEIRRWTGCMVRSQIE